MTITERFSTDDVDPAERLAFWNRLASETYEQHVVEPRTAAFRGTLLRRSFGELSLSQVTTTPAVLHGEMPSWSPREYKHAIIALQDAGSSEQTSGGARTQLIEGTMALNMLAPTRTISFHAPTRFIILKLPATRLASRLGDLGRLLDRRVEAREGALLAGFLRALVAADLPATEPGRDEALGDVLCNLIALSYHRAGAAAAPRPPAREATDERWRRTVREFVDRHLEDPQLSAGMIAHQLGVTPRYVQMVFARMATTASAYVLARRLERAAQLLRRGEGPIADAALRAGFSDLSYFYRSFHKRFGTSPRRYALQLR